MPCLQYSLFLRTNVLFRTLSVLFACVLSHLLLLLLLLLLPLLLPLHTSG
jgi:hypothetical protein